MKRGGIYADDKRIGWYLFPASMLYVRINRQTVNITFNGKNGLTILLKSRPVAHMASDSLEYDGGQFVFSDFESDSGTRPGISRIRDNALVAVSNGDGSMEFNTDLDPVVLSFSLLSLCLVRISGQHYPAHSIVPDTIRVMFFEENRNISPVFLTSFIIGTIAFIPMSQRFNTGMPAMILVGAYGSFLILFILFFVIVTYFRRATKIVRTG